MSKARTKEIVVSVVFPIILGISVLTLASWILPKNCGLFSSNVAGPQMCHTIPHEPECEAFCQDGRTESIVSMVAVFGVCLFFLPVVVYVMKNLRNRPAEQTKLFD